MMMINIDDDDDADFLQGIVTKLKRNYDDDHGHVNHHHVNHIADDG